MKRFALLGICAFLLVGLTACTGSGNPHRKYQAMLGKAEDASYLEAEYVTTVRVPLAGDLVSIHTTGTTRRQGGGASLRLWGDRTLELWEEGFSYSHWYRDGVLRLEPFSQGLGEAPLSLEECFPTGLLVLDEKTQGNYFTNEGAMHFNFLLQDWDDPALDRALEGLLHPSLELLEQEFGLAWESPSSYTSPLYVVSARNSLPETVSISFGCTLMVGGQAADVQVLHYVEFTETGGQGEISFPDGFDDLPLIELEEAA